MRRPASRPAILRRAGTAGLWSFSLLLLATVTLHADTTLSFQQALDRAMKVRALSSTYEEHASTLEALPFRNLPVVRAETGISSAENLNLLSESVGRFDAFTAVVSVDYPLLDGGAEQRRALGARTDAQLIRRRAVDEAEDVFRQTLDAVAALYTAEQRIRLLRDGAQRAAVLRDRARLMLEAGAISNVTATTWQDQALATESMLLDLELQRLEAETRVRQLIGDTGTEPLHIEIDIREEPMLKEIRFDQVIRTDTAVASASLQEQRRQLALEESLAARRPQVLLSAFGGVAAVPSSFRGDTSEGTFGIYGLRLSLSLPMFDPASARRVAEARLELEEAARVKTLTATATKNRLDLLWLGMAAAEKRIDLLTQAVEVAKRRQESVIRLVTAGVRSETELVEAANEVARRESDLLAVRIDRWKLQQIVRRMAADDRSKMLRRASLSP
ncbi:MAG TPA: TolC family protein [Thermoanaerobaculia bacterium]